LKCVEPIRNKQQIDKMKDFLTKHNLRDCLLFVLGINSGLRISDLLLLKISDVKDKERISLREKKTGKTKDFPIADTCKKVINEYLSDGDKKDDWLFKSKRGQKPITRIQAYRIINQAARAVGITDAIGTHTLRKTFGYWAYKQGADVTRIQKLLNHSAPSVTLAYIGITKDELDTIYIKLNL